MLAIYAYLYFYTSRQKVTLYLSNQIQFISHKYINILHGIRENKLPSAINAWCIRLGVFRSRSIANDVCGIQRFTSGPK